MSISVQGGRIGLVLGLMCVVIGLSILASWGVWDKDTSNMLLFGAWSASLVLLFVLALHLPVQSRLSSYQAFIRTPVLVIGAIGITFAANVALFRHDVHFDLTRERRFTPSPQVQAVFEHLRRDVAVTYFYNNNDGNARHTKELLEILARQRPSLHFRAVDLDKEPALARRYNVRFYNTAVVEAESRRIQVERTTDLTQIAFSILRVLKEQVQTVCLVVGHGEFSKGGQDKYHRHTFAHVETLHGHKEKGSGDVLVGEPRGLDQLYRALEDLGYAIQEVVLALQPSIPNECAVVADIGPRTAYTPGESALLAAYLAAGGRVLLMYDPFFELEPHLQDLLAKIGVLVEQTVVVDPLDHFATDPEKIAIPYYPPHPITTHLALTFFPEARPLRIADHPPGVTVTPLFSSSQDSYTRPLGMAETKRVSTASTEGDRRAENPGRTGAAVLAVAVQGLWPGTSSQKTFQLVLVGDSDFATNAFFSSVSNGELAVSMIRWLTGDKSLPAVSPKRYALPQVTLTYKQMQGIFVVIEILLPLSVILVGAIVWWRRR